MMLKAQPCSAHYVTLETLVIMLFVRVPPPGDTVLGRYRVNKYPGIIS